VTRSTPDDPLDGIRPGRRRSFWLREALAAEPDALAADVAAPPFAGRGRFDVAILGGGYTGLWTALRIREIEPAATVVVIEQDLCGSGPSGRNGGFVTGWWDELPGLVHRFGEAEALRTARALDTAIGSLGPWTADHGVDAELVERGFLQVSAAPAQDDAWLEATEACARLDEGDRWQALAPAEVADRARSPVFRAGAFMPCAATVQPARLARGLRRVALEQGIVIHERTVATMPADEPRRPSGAGRGPVEVATSSAEGSGVIEADQVVVATNAWAAAWRPVAGRLLNWSSYIVITEPVPDVLAEIGWTGGEGIADGRFTVHYGRTTADGRIALGGGGGRGAFGGRIGRSYTDDAGAAVRAADGLRRWFPALAGCGSRMPGAARSTSPTTIGRGSGRGRAAGSTTASGTAATASRRRSSAAGSSRRSRPAARATTRTRACRSSATGRRHGHSRRSRCGAPAHASFARPWSGASRPRRQTPLRAGSSGRSRGSRAGWATTWGPSRDGSAVGSSVRPTSGGCCQAEPNGPSAGSG
jgi:glycine/D-amino acid oxidase-like deaminating enzyme